MQSSRIKTNKQQQPPQKRYNNDKNVNIETQYEEDGQASNIFTMEEAEDSKMHSSILENNNPHQNQEKVNHFYNLYQQDYENDMQHNIHENNHPLINHLNKSKSPVEICNPQLENNKRHFKGVNDIPFDIRRKSSNNVGKENMNRNDNELFMTPVTHKVDKIQKQRYQPIHHQEPSFPAYNLSNNYPVRETIDIDNNSNILRESHNINRTQISQTNNKYMKKDLSSKSLIKDRDISPSKQLNCIFLIKIFH